MTRHHVVDVVAHVVMSNAHLGGQLWRPLVDYDPNYVGRHRLSANWALKVLTWLPGDDSTGGSFMINLDGGAFG